MTSESPAAEASVATERPVQYIRANGLEFGYFEAVPAGANPERAPLVFVLHGFPDTASSFLGLIDALAAAGFRAVAPAMRGYAPSEIPENGDYSVATLGQDVLALIEHFGVDRAFVVGHDWGAVAAYAAAALRPDRVRGIVAAAVPHLRRFLLRPSREQLAASHYVFKLQLPFWPERTIREDDNAWLVDLARSWSPGWIPDAGYLEPLRANFRDADRIRAAVGYYRALPPMLVSRIAWQFLLKPITVPARVVRGATDHCMLPATFDDAEHLFGIAHDLVTLDCGHFMALEAPEAFTAAVVDFLKRH